MKWANGRLIQLLPDDYFDSLSVSLPPSLPFPSLPLASCLCVWHERARVFIETICHRYSGGFQFVVIGLDDEFVWILFPFLRLCIDGNEGRRRGRRRCGVGGRGGVGTNFSV